MQQSTVKIDAHNRPARNFVLARAIHNLFISKFLLRFQKKIPEKNHKNTDADNVELCLRDKFQLKITYIQNCTKMIKSDRFGGFLL
jgi:hypothetical protein